jgi:predicted Ser/Thr protein kinase
MGLVAPTCPRCGQDVPPESRFCLQCGKRLQRKSGAMGTVPERLQRALGQDYAVGGEIGRGGFGVVYSVQDLALDRKLAVKVIRPELVAADVVVARFQREAKIVAQLNHPNVLGVIFAGEAEGLVYCGMRHIAGDTLRERLKRDGPMTVTHALRVFGEIAQGLEHAHQRGIIHRDVKPANIMLDHDGSDRAVLLDFGIAKGLSVGNGKLSISGQIVGSPRGTAARFVRCQDAAARRARGVRADPGAVHVGVAEWPADERARGCPERGGHGRHLTRLLSVSDRSRHPPTATASCAHAVNPHNRRPDPRGAARRAGRGSYAPT